jgi:hypothetical protein
MKYLRVQDQLEESGATASGALSPSDFSGRWLNTNQDTPGVTRVMCKSEGNALRVRFEGNGSSEPSEWGEATAELLCAAAIHGGPAMSFVASFDLGFKNVRVGANLNQGLLVIATFHSWQNHNGVGRSNYFSREFFHRVDQS